jgi:hypothetical protein
MPALVVFVVAFGAYAWTAAPAAGWLDSPEFVAAASTLGVPHSPGHPVPVLLARAAQLLPFGDADLRVALASALAVAAAAALLTLAVERLAARVAPEASPGLRAAMAGSAGLAFAASGAAWLQAVRAEVYGSEIATLALALVLLLADQGRPPRRGLAAAALALGLGLANHHYMTLVFAAPLAVWALAGRPGWRAVAASTLATLGGLVAYAYLPLRALRDPLVDWGDPDTPARFVWTVSARAFQKSLGAGQHAVDTRAADALQVAASLVEQVSPLGMLLVLVGAYVLVRRRDARGVALALVGVIVCTAGGRALLGFDFDNPDALGYLLPALLAAFVLAGAGLCALVPTLRRAAPLLVLAAFATVAWQVSAHAANASRRRAESGDVWTHALVASLPPRAVLVTSYFETSFQLAEIVAVEHARPDVIVYDRGFATYPGVAEAARRRFPELAPAIDAGLRVGLPTPEAALATLARTRPVFFELAPTLDANVTSVGLLARFGAAVEPSNAAAAAEDAMRTLERRLPLDADARRALVWHEFLRARLACTKGEPAVAAPAFARARRLDPDDPSLAALAVDCGL